MEITFRKGTEEVGIVRILNKSLYFGKIIQGIPYWLPLEKLNIGVEGIVKQFPDLEGKPYNEIKQEGARRLKEHIKTMKTEEEIKDYVINEIEAWLGAKAVVITKPGFRPQIIRRGEDAQ